MPYFCVVERTGAFTLFADYEINDLTVKADDGETWYLHDMGDGYVGCTTYDGKEVAFLSYD
ncbi:hypothetical protein [Escherichia coli]|jgi:hypothetical protein|uniref:hypothetical protein n=1 Tax=Escherichia coli TaxID=562 RepID=UPI00038FE2E2|nr:hypothetical protein [Escherichia coli]DAZ01828.1 MAG TPA: Putative minor capsid protein [Caudoviricetes sp.]EFN3802792.1 hypothetical protein [Escherichia coli]EIH7479314.1 hypothetical protein [Escherichia coli]EKT8257398.1 hypothetical protein [Escherichia coli]EKU1521962.1 hypothetical protein [Escherichia coli]